MSEIKQISIRTAQQGDFSFIFQGAQQILNVFNETPANFDQRFAQIFSNCLKDPNHNPIFIAEKNNRPVGFCSGTVIMSPEMGCATFYLPHLFVSEESRNKGIGTHILNYIKSYCKGNNIKAVEVTSPPKTYKYFEKLLKFFKRNNYDVIGPGFVSTEENWILSCE